MLLLIGPLWTNFSEIFNETIKIFIHENASENIVCEMSAILSWGRWVKQPWWISVNSVSTKHNEAHRVYIILGMYWKESQQDQATNITQKKF